MGVMQKIKGKAEQVAGAAKAKAGHRRGDENLVFEGENERARGEGRDAAASAGQAARGLGEEIKGKAKGAMGALRGDTKQEISGKVEAVKGKVRQGASRS